MKSLENTRLNCNDTIHPVYGKRDIITMELKSDGWWYMDIGYRFHGEKRKNSNIFKYVWDLEKI